nr:MAG TPA: hypothetical protein [Caudoviricetes sp.]
MRILYNSGKRYPICDTGWLPAVECGARVSPSNILKN